jgi:hypothetical protein
VKIETKFNVGDKVWVGHVEETHMKIAGPLQVSEIDVKGKQFLNRDEVVVQYKLCGGWYHERVVHSSLEEAIAYCQGKLNPPQPLANIPK